jgi:hypothetical protein
MDLQALASELTTDELERGYSGITDTEAADSLNAKNRTRNKTSMTGSEILNAVDAGEWATRTAEQKRIVWDIAHLGTANPFGIEATLMTSAFAGSGGATINALIAARVESISRATELTLGNVRAADVQRARA